MQGRRLASAFIAVFLLAQLYVPLRYYLSDQPADERFAWRMFSPLRLQRCRVSVSELVVREGRALAQPVPLDSTLPVPWVELVHRGSRDVVDGLLVWRCTQSDAGQVRYERSCTSVSGREAPVEVHVLDCPTEYGPNRTEPRR